MHSARLKVFDRQVVVRHGQDEDARAGTLLFHISLPLCIYIYRYIEIYPHGDDGDVFDVCFIV